MLKYGSSQDNNKERKEQNQSNGNVIFWEVLRGKQGVELDKEFLEKSKFKICY